MTKEDEIRQTTQMYENWIIEIERHIERLRHEQAFYRIRKGAFSRMVAFGIGLKIRYSQRQLRQMHDDKQRALNRIP